MKYLIIVMAVLLSGCGDASKNSQELGWRFTTDAVKEVVLKDGTLCVVFQGTHGGGITCNWK